MAERQPEENLFTNKNEIKSRLNKLYVSGLLGTFFGGISFGISRLFADQFLAERIGIGVGGSFALIGLGATWSNISLDRAEDYLDRGENARARLQGLRAIAEVAGGMAISGGLVGSETGNSITSTVIGGGVGAAFGLVSGYFGYRERMKPFPDLITPAGNSTIRDLSFPRRMEGTQFPPVFRASSLKDFIEFREINKEKIVKWATSIPDRSDEPDSILSSNLVTSIALIPNVRHYPAFDPEKGQEMKLMDDKESGSLLAHASEHTFLFWPHQTCFESITLNNRDFEKKLWKQWRERSWRNEIVLLTQYQTSKTFDPLYKPEDVSNNYWLLDIIGGEDGRRRRVDRKIPQAKRSPVFNPIPEAS